MKAKTIGTGAAWLLLAGVSLVGVTDNMRTRWLNEETALQSKWQWDEHCRQYGELSNFVFYGYQYNTNITVPI